MEYLGDARGRRVDRGTPLLDDKNGDHRDECRMYVCGTIVRGDDDARGSSAMVVACWCGYRLWVIGYRLSVIGYRYDTI